MFLFFAYPHLTLFIPSSYSLFPPSHPLLPPISPCSHLHSARPPVQHQPPASAPASATSSLRLVEASHLTSRLYRRHTEHTVMVSVMGEESVVTTVFIVAAVSVIADIIIIFTIFNYFYYFYCLLVLT